MLVKLDRGAFMPRREHPTDAGADGRTPRGFWLLPLCAHTVDTGVHVQLPKGTKLDVRTKSGLYFRCDIITDGLVDEGYTGAIKVRLHNLGMRPHRFRAGDKIAQLVVTPVLYPTFEQASKIEGGERGDGGFGSTGR